VRIALDTNILVYAEGLEQHSDDARKVAVCRTLVPNLIENPAFTPVVPTQALLELFHVLTRKAGRTAAEARAVVAEIAGSFEVAPVDAEVIELALDVATANRFQIFDSTILAGAMRAGCELLLSEDLHGGFHRRGLTVTSPFASPPHPAIAGLLGR
jgi:predicted nucleic acid-binding protein